MNWSLAIAIITLSVSAQTAGAQQLLIYPVDGQSTQQQATDEAECRAWATQQTGFDPAAGPPPNMAAAPSGSGEVVGGAARGALLGVVGGAIAGDVGKGAAS